MNFKQISALLCVSTVLSMNVIASKALAQEQPSIQFEKAIANKCIEDQLTGTDGRSLSIIFKDFRAADGTRKPCLLRVNTIIPSGFIVQDIQVLYQGSNEVNSGSQGTSLSRSYVFVGGAYGIVKAPPTTTKFTSTNPLFQEQDNLTVASASCGGEGQLAINLVAQSSKGGSITVDTADINAGDVKIHVKLAPC